MAVVWLAYIVLARRGALEEQSRYTGSSRISNSHSSSGHRLLWATVLFVGSIPIVVLAGLIPGWGPPGLYPIAQASTTDYNPACPSANRALDGVWLPSRLIVHDPCQHLVGTVDTANTGETDGDIDVYVTPDLDYVSLTGAPQNLDNVRRFGYGGDILMELMPRDGESTDPRTGKTRSAHLPELSVGDRVDIWGAWVFDAGHGFYEIHPVYSMSISEDGGSTWGETYTSGPQYGGNPATSSSVAVYDQCRDENNHHCLGYYNPNPPHGKGKHKGKKKK